MEMKTPQIYLVVVMEYVMKPLVATGRASVTLIIMVQCVNIHVLLIAIIEEYLPRMEFLVFVILIQMDQGVNITEVVHVLMVVHLNLMAVAFVILVRMAQDVNMDVFQHVMGMEIQ